MVRPGTSFSWSGLELSCDPWLDWERHFFDAFPGAMVGIGAERRKRDSGSILVLEHRRKPDHVFVFSLSARSSRRDRVFAELDHLYSQFDADSEATSRIYRSDCVTTSARKQLAGKC